MNKIEASEEIKNWLSSICYEGAGELLGDCQVLYCKGCGEGAWLMEDIKHKRKCDVARMKKALSVLTPKSKENKDES